MLFEYSQLVLAYQSYKALKPAPPPRKRRKANDDGRNPSVYAETLRKRRIKTMAKAWLVLILATKIEWLMKAIFGWWLPLYGTLRFGAHAAFILCHITIGEIGFTNLIVPTLRPYEKPLNAVVSILDDVADITGWLLTSTATTVWHIFRIALAPFQRIWQILTWPYHRLFRSREDEPMHEEPVAEAPIDAKTPRRSKRSTKPRYSQVATPHVPGHLVEEDQAFPPVQARLDPAERSHEDLPAFQEALDRAQAAFYEASSPQRPNNTAFGNAGQDEKHTLTLASRRNGQQGKGKHALDAEDPENEESTKRRKVQKTHVKGSDHETGQSRVTLGSGKRDVNGGRKHLSSQNGRIARNRGGNGTSKLPQLTDPPLSAAVKAESGQVVEPAITRSSQRARETALAARKRAREEALSRKVIANQVDSRIAKRKKAV